MKYIILASALIFSTSLRGQLEIHVDGTSALINFEDTLADVNIGSYTAEAAPVEEPILGELDANAWSFQGFDELADSSRGVSPGGETEGGIYAFVVDQDTFLGVQPTANDFNPGSITLQVINNSGADLNQIDLTYELWINNDEPRANALHFLVSVDSMTFDAIPELSDTSIEGSDELGFQATTLMATISLADTVKDGEGFLIRWQGQDVSGTGNRDEFGIDDIQITNAVLPVEMTSFSVELIDEAVELFWQTASEHNSDHFSVERSADAKLFTEIGTVRGQGTSLAQYSYAFKDRNPLPGVNYYRIVQYDYDGQATVHPLRSIVNDKDFQVYPSLASEYLNLVNSAELLQITIINQWGQVIETFTAPNLQRINVSHYRAGLYYLLARSNTLRSTHSFVKI